MKKILILSLMAPCIVCLLACASVEKSILKSLPMNKVASVAIRLDTEDVVPWQLTVCLKKDLGGTCFRGYGESLAEAVKNINVKLQIIGSKIEIKPLQ